MDEDPELLRAFAARESWAYDAAYRIYARTLHAAAYGVLQRSQDAADCVHDTLLQLWRRDAAFRPERGSLRAFLAVCVRNEALSRARKASNRDRILHAIPPANAAGDVGDDVVRRESMRAALQSLTEKQRRSIQLAYYGGLTHEQVAAELGEPVGTIKSRLSASLRRLRDAFAPEDAR